MKILCVLAHPKEDSLNVSLLKKTVEIAGFKGHDVKVKDLYRERFNPVASPIDYDNIFAGNTIAAEDVKKEQADILWADMVIFHYPVWWFDRPAILKGWFDRVFASGFSFVMNEKGEYAFPLEGKKALVITTAGQVPEFYKRLGCDEVFLKTMQSGSLEFCKFEVKSHTNYGIFSGTSHEDIKSKIESTTKFLKENL